MRASLPLNVACCLVVSVSLGVSIAAQESFIAYEVDEGVAGNQDFGGSLGLDFDVNAHGRVTRLGVFDSGSDGLARTITARLFNRDTLEELATIEFTADDPGDLVGGSRFKALDEPVFLASGFHGTISAEGYGAGEPNGNVGVMGLSIDPGPENEISFVGGGRFGDPGAFPANPDGGPANRYAAGTFEFRPALIAYDVPAGTAGNQDFGGALGHDFNVNAEILITRLGVFDSGSDGLAATITARIFDRDTETEITSLEFTPEDPGDQAGGSRFKNLPEPLSLPAGFHGTVSANGYGAGEPNGNQGVGPLSGLMTDDGPCSIEFVGGGRFGDAATPDAFPGSPDGGPPNRYAAGTFEYEAVGVVEKGGIAYVVPEGTVGGQAFGGSLGMDFDVLEDIEITRLGVFDSAGDGLNATITAQVFSRGSENELARLEFTPEDAGELVGGSRLKPLDPPLALPAGFAGTIVASGYGDSELNGNGLAGPTTDSGGCMIAFVGGGRFGDPASPATYPASVDAGPANRYAAGTFEFRPSEVEIPTPAPPGDVSATASDGTVTISWSAPTEGAPVEGYNVYRAGGGARVNAELITSTEYILDGLINGAEACLVVRSAGLAFESADSAEACATPTSGAVPDGTFVAYEVAAGTAGNQNFGGALGKHFTVNSDIVITRLGVFDSGSDGLAVPIVAVLFERSARLELARIEFTPDDAGELVGGSRFKALSVPIELPAGFEGTISAGGYGDAENNGNLNLGDLPLSTNDGGCAVSFGGMGNAAAPDAFPAGFDPSRAPHHYASGTFEFGLRPGVEPAPAGGGIAYNVPEGTAGNQNFGGPLGLDFIVNQPIRVTELGVFDDLGDGLQLTITARLFNRETQEEVTSLVFNAMDQGELLGGSRFKPLDPPLSLPAGFQGTMVAVGYGDAERNGNQGSADLGTFTDDGGCLLSFVGGGRFGDAAAPAAFPTNVDGGPADRYASGTFRFEADTDVVAQLGGDCNQSGGLEVGDLTCYVNSLFPGFVLPRPSAGAPCGSEAGSLAVVDVNGDGAFDVSDVAYLSSYLFMSGSPPAQGVGCFAVGEALGCDANPGCQ